MRQHIVEQQALGQRHLGSTRSLLVCVEEPRGCCPICGQLLCVQKTVRRHGATLEHGPFVAGETICVCPAGCRQGGTPVVRHAATLAERLPPRGVFGYDVIVFVGLQRYVQHRQRDEIRATLARQYGLVLSAGEVSDLGHRFLAYLEALQESRAPALRAALDADGGWPLHIDATGEDGRGTLLAAFAGWRGWVLGAWKIPTERADAILPRLKGVVEKYGAPCAIMRDLGRAMKEAADGLVATLGQPIAVLACHLHFLRDVGKDLLGEAHDRLRDLLRRADVKTGLRALARHLGRALGKGIAQARKRLLDWQAAANEEHQLPDGRVGLAAVRAIAQWVLDSHTDGQDLGFPFDLPHLDFYERCHTACRAADAFLRRPASDAAVHKALRRLRGVVAPVDGDVPFQKVAATLRARAALFTELRGALHLREKPSGKTPPSTRLTPDEALVELRDIEAAVAQLRVALLRRRPARGPAKDLRGAIDLVLAHLERHGRFLFGHAIRLPAAAGGGIRLVDRTNNIEESLFHHLKRGERRRSGRKVLSQDLEQLPPAALLALNLHHDDFVAILCGTLDKLPTEFANLDVASRRRSSLLARAADRTPDASDCDIASASLPNEDRHIIRTDEMRRRIRAAARSRAPRS